MTVQSIDSEATTPGAGKGRMVKDHEGLYEGVKAEPTKLPMYAP